MEADMPGKQPESDNNACCEAWTRKCAKLEEKRKALREAVNLLVKENDKIKAVYEQERARADAEKEEKVKESSARAELENDISALKSEILSLKHKGNGDADDTNNEVKLLKAHVFEGQKEISHLKVQIEKERKRADSERKNVEVENKRAAEAQKLLDGERYKVDQEKKLAEVERKRAEEHRRQLELLKKEADETKTVLNFERVKLKEANKKLEAEKQKMVKEKKRAESEKAKVEEQRKLVEAHQKKFLEEKRFAESLSLNLEENRQLIDGFNKEILELRSSRNSYGTSSNLPDNNLKSVTKDRSSLVSELSSKLEGAKKDLQLEKQKAVREKERADTEMVKAEQQKRKAEVNWKKAMEEKCRADQLSKQLEENKQKINDLQKKVSKPISNGQTTDAGRTEAQLLKKKLKFEKMQKKHAKEVAKLEKSRNSILQQELGRLKLELFQFSHRLEMLNTLCSPVKEVDGLDKELNTKVLCGQGHLQAYLQSQNGPLIPCCMNICASNPCSHILQHAIPMFPVSSGNCIEPFTGIDSKLESLLGGSTRTMLTSSALNSKKGSFSNGQLVGSQEKGAFSVTTSAKMVEENVQSAFSNLSGEVTIMTCGENPAVVAENSVRSPSSTNNVENVVEHSRKRRKIHDAVASIEHLYFEDKRLHLQIEEKLSFLLGILNRQTDKPMKDGRFQCTTLQNSHAKHDKVSKKRKASFEEKLVAQHKRDSDELKKKNKVETEKCGTPNVLEQACPTLVDLIGTAKANRKGVSDVGTGDFEISEGREELASGGYMRLLNLDNAADEECYRVAMELPLSPTLPEIEFQPVEMSSIDNTVPLVREKLIEGLSNKEDILLPSCGFDVISVEISSNKLKSSGCQNYHVPPVNASLLEKSGIGDFGAKLEMSNAPVLRDDDTKFSYVLPKNLDRSSISRVFSVIKSCIKRLSLFTQTDWMMQEILLALKTEEKLLPKEKAAVVFALLLLNFSLAASSKFDNYINWASIPCVDSFAGIVNSVMCDVEKSTTFAGLGCLDEVLSLSEDFILDGTIMIYDTSSCKECTSRTDISVDFSNMRLCSVPASKVQLVAGSIILASICAATHNIGFICEASFNILCLRKFDDSLMLTILHVFAHFGGEKFFNQSSYSLLMAVLKSVVVFLEEKHLSDDAAALTQSASDTQTHFCPCVKCPFVNDAISMDAITPLLLEKLNNDATFGTTFSKKAYGAVERHCDDSCCLNKISRSTNESKALTAVTLCDLTNIFSLVELIAFFMGWQWAFVKIVSQLMKAIESCVIESFTSGIVILLGQLGRLGVHTSGYDDKGVEQLRAYLSTFLGRQSTKKVGLPVQIAIVSALLGLLDLDFETLVRSSPTLQVIASQAAPADSVRNWFSSLSKEHQDLSFNLLKSGGVNNNELHVL